MRITFVLPGIGLWGGIRSIYELSNRLQAKGHCVSLVYPHIPMWSGSKWYDLRRLVRVVVGAVKQLGPAMNPDWFDLKADLIKVPTLAQCWIPDGDIVIATLWSTAYYVNSYGKEKGEKFYFPRHYEVWCGPTELVDRSYLLPLHKIVASNWLKEIIETKFDSTVLGVLPNGINFNTFYQERTNFKCHSPKRIGMLYRRGKWKGMEDGIRAFMMARESFPDIKLILFGEKPIDEDRTFLGDLKNYEFHERPYGETLRKIYNSLDIFIFSSHDEGFGNPPMEAMACGAAVVTTNVGAVPDYTVAGETALISPPKMPSELARNIMILLENDEERIRIAKKGGEYIRRFNWDNTTDDLEKIFMMTLGKRELG